MLTSVRNPTIIENFLPIDPNKAPIIGDAIMQHNEKELLEKGMINQIKRYLRDEQTNHKLRYLILMDGQGWIKRWHI